MILILFVPLVWGNVPALCAILPVPGGALGAVIGVIMAYACLIVGRLTGNILYKVLVFIVAFLINVAVLYGVGLLVVGIATSI